MKILRVLQYLEEFQTPNLERDVWTVDQVQALAILYVEIIKNNCFISHDWDDNEEGRMWNI